MHDTVETAISEMAAQYKPGGFVGLAGALARRASVFFNQMTFQPGHQPGINTLRAAMRVTGDVRPLHALAAEFGYVLHRLGDFRDCSDVELLRLILDVGQARGAMDASIRAALEDGRIERHEARAIRGRVEAEVQTLLEMLSRVDALVVAEEEARPPRMQAVKG